MKKIILLTVGITFLLNAEFTRNVNGVVTDSNTTLEWQDSYIGTDSMKKSTWHSALLYCEGLLLDGRNDWRLPNMNELMSLVDHSKFQSKIDQVFENYDDRDSYDDVFWSSSTYITHPEKAWGVGFAHGEDRKYVKNKRYFVRCVRSD